MENDNNIANDLSINRYNWLMHLQHVRGEIDACRNFIKTYIKPDEIDHEYSLYKQGVMFQEEGRVQEALHLFQKCYQLNRCKALYAKEVGKCLFYMNRYRLSLEAFQEAERISDVPDWEIYQRIAECFLHLGDVKNGKEFARKAIQYGKQEESYSLLTKIFDLEGDVGSAIAVCTAAIGFCPDNVDMMTQLGMFHLRQRETQMAFEKFTTALEVNPECTTALLGVGCITQAHGEYDVALSKYKIALYRNPESVALWNNVGLCFYSKKKYVAAISCLKRALWISPLNWKVLFNLGLVHLSTEQIASAFNFFCAAINIRSDISISFNAIGCALFELRDFHNALRAFRQAESISPKNPLTVANLCICLYFNEMYEEALSTSQEILTLQKNENIDKEVIDLCQHVLVLLEAKMSSVKYSQLLEKEEFSRDLQADEV